MTNPSNNQASNPNNNPSAKPPEKSANEQAVPTPAQAPKSGAPVESDKEAQASKKEEKPDATKDNQTAGTAHPAADKDKPANDKPASDKPTDTKAA